MQYQYVKYTNVPQFTSELSGTPVAPLATSITFSNGLLTVQTSRTLTPTEQNILYQKVIAHVPPPIALPTVEARISAAMDFGKSLIIEFSARNVLNGITTDQVRELSTDLALLQQLLQSGSLYTALDEIESLTPKGILTQDDINYFRDKIKTFLGIQ